MTSILEPDSVTYYRSTSRRPGSISERALVDLLDSTTDVVDAMPTSTFRRGTCVRERAEELHAVLGALIDAADSDEPLRGWDGS